LTPNSVRGSLVSFNLDDSSLNGNYKWPITGDTPLLTIKQIELNPVEKLHLM